ncbi:MAG: GWxTD domain-containing protein [Balneolaceae bacterium]|nr:GWxTD domain-containing protein [Balneolaceae bacterium]MCH8549916.1 GWxTD domain-containing protein [Balneolaceae bacterium]
MYPFLLIFLVSLSTAVQTENPKEHKPASPTNIELAEHLLKEDNWELAIRVLLQPFSDGNDPLPEAGFKAIRVAAKYNAVDFYGAVSQAYLVALKNSTFSEHSDLLHIEANELLPLLSEEESEEIKALISNESDDLQEVIAGYWIQQNPYPSTPVNERLIEHFVRIQYAKENFTLASNTVYGTDDRGLIFVRFGEPHRMIREQIPLNEIQDPATGEVYNVQSNALIDFHLWSYNEQTDDELLFIFGREQGMGRFGLRNSIISMIPTSGNHFSGSNFNTGQSLFSGESNLSPSDSSAFGVQDQQARIGGNTLRRSTTAFMIQYGLLERLAVYHPYFSNLYEDITSEILTLNPPGGRFSFDYVAESIGGRYINKEERNFQLRDYSAPEFHSNLLNRSNQILSNYKLYHFFDEEGNPDLYYSVKNRHEVEDALPELNFTGVITIQDFDSGWNQLRSERLKMNETGDSSLFSIEKAAADSLFTLYSVELFNQREDDKLQIIASTGLVKLEKEDHTFSSNDHFSISDVIFGTYNPDGEGRAVIRPNHDKLFRSNDEAGVYFEVFSNSIDEYTVSYRFERRNFWGRWRAVDDRLSATVDFTHPDRRSQNWFEFNLLELPKGEMRMVIEFSAEDSEPIRKAHYFSVEN